MATVHGWLNAAGVSVVGWTYVHALWQAAVVSGGLVLVLRTLPTSAPRLRSAAAGSAFLVVVLATVLTAGALTRDWQTHQACWRRAAPDSAVSAHCAGHGVTVATHTSATGSSLKGEAVLPGVRLGAPLGVLPAPVRSTARTLSRAAGFVAFVWAIVVLAALVRLLGTVRLVCRVRGLARPVADPELRRVLTAVTGRFGVRRSVDVRESELTASPAVAGWRQPVVLLPRGLSVALTPSQLRDVLTHELAHVRRNDFAVNLFQCLLESVFVLNPFVRWICKQIREEREAICDGIAAGEGRSSRRRYMESLLLLERHRGSANPVLVRFLGQGSLLSRARRIAEMPLPETRNRRTGRAAAMAGYALAILIVLVQTGLPATRLSSWALMQRDLDLRAIQVGTNSTTP